MKSIFVLTFLLFISSATLLAQRKHAAPVGMGGTPFKGAEKIIAEYHIASDSLFNMLAKQVSQHGYTIARQEKDSLLIITDLKLVNGDIKYVMRLAIVDKILTLSSTCMVADLKIKFKNARYQPLVYYPKGYISHVAFNEVLSFVRGTGPVSIAYAK